MASQLLRDNKYKKVGRHLFYPTWTKLFEDPSFKLAEYTVTVEQVNAGNNAELQPADRIATLSATKPAWVSDSECTYVKPLCVSIILNSC